MPASEERIVPRAMHVKSCDVCRRHEGLRELGVRTYELPTRAEVFVFTHRDVICSDCGFLFSADVPDADFLHEYYAAAFTHASDTTSIEPDYDAGARLDLLARHVAPGATVMEVGAAEGEFLVQLAERGYRPRGVDPLEAGRGGSDVERAFLTGAAAVGGERLDAVAAYYVLEHVAEPARWLAEATAPLAAGGLLLLEVPDVLRFPVESLYPEHVTHWTPFHLERLVRSAGFAVLEIEQRRPSRPFGFALAARRLAEGENLAAPLQRPPGPEAVVAAYARGLALQAADRERRQALAAELATRASGGLVVIWAANDLALSLARDLRERGVSRVVLADNAIDKVGRRLPGLDEPVSGPSFENWRAESAVFLLCSPLWNPVIRRQIEDAGIDRARIVDAVAWSAG